MNTKYLDTTKELDDDEIVEFGDQEYERLYNDIQRYVPVECDVTKEFFEMAVITMTTYNGINADSKQWDKKYKEILGYVLHPNGKGIDEYLNYTFEIGYERAIPYAKALRRQGFLEATKEYKRDAYRAKAYAIKMAKERNQ